MAKITKTLYVTDREKWRAWLKKNHERQKEVWLIYYKKHSGKPRIPYDDAVEEALCFGWIDSTVRKLDEERYAQRYTPRNDRSIWADSNIRRAKRMIRQGRMTEAGLAKFRLAGTKKAAIVHATLRMPADLKEALAADEKAYENFRKLAPSYRKIYIWWVTSAKKEETRSRRIRKAVELAAKNRKIPGLG